MTRNLKAFSSMYGCSTIPASTRSTTEYLQLPMAWLRVMVQVGMVGHEGEQPGSTVAPFIEEEGDDDDEVVVEGVEVERVGVERPPVVEGVDDMGIGVGGMLLAPFIIIIDPLGPIMTGVMGERDLRCMVLMSIPMARYLLQAPSTSQVVGEQPSQGIMVIIVMPPLVLVVLQLGTGIIIMGHPPADEPLKGPLAVPGIIIIMLMLLPPVVEPGMMGVGLLPGVEMPPEEVEGPLVDEDDDDIMEEDIMEEDDIIMGEMALVSMTMVSNLKGDTTLCVQMEARVVFSISVQSVPGGHMLEGTHDDEDDDDEPPIIIMLPLPPVRIMFPLPVVVPLDDDEEEDEGPVVIIMFENVAVGGVSMTMEKLTPPG